MTSVAELQTFQLKVGKRRFIPGSCRRSELQRRKRQQVKSGGLNKHS